LFLGCAWSAQARAEDAVVRPARVAQRITGFGASSAWTAPDLTDAEADLLFSPDSGIGLSLLRVRIAPDGTCAEVATAQQAQARGAQVWATPWSPPAAWKSNGDVNNGGTLLPAHADDWANSLASFVGTMQAQGVNLIGLSAQNEPTMKVNYESCVYTAASLADFMTHHLRPALDSAGLSLPIIAPETVGWSDLPSFSAAILADPSATAAVGVFATHSYNGSPAASTAIAQAGKELWQTEVYDQNAADPGINSALFTALNINAALVRGNVTAWHYWWIKPRGDTPADNSALWDQNNLPSKRLYALGNFSRFVRPGFNRVEVPLSPAAGIALSAFADPVSNQLVIVAINQNAAAVTQTFSFDGVSTTAWQSWVTSPDSDLAPGDTIADSTVLSYTFAPQSITTLRGSITGAAPAIPDGSTSTDTSNDSTGCACSVPASTKRGTGSTLSLAAFAAALWVIRRRSVSSRPGVSSAPLTRSGLRRF
jgi:glucuronoarabinoxylan endo-1,4-beta-xylanase